MGHCKFCGKSVHEANSQFGFARNLGDVAAVFSEMGSRKKVCQKCGATYCLDCGRKNSGSIICPGCRTVWDEDAAYHEPVLPADPSGYAQWEAMVREREASVASERAQPAARPSPQGDELGLRLDEDGDCIELVVINPRGPDLRFCLDHADDCTHLLDMINGEVRKQWGRALKADETGRIRNLWRCTRPVSLEPAAAAPAESGPPAARKTSQKPRPTTPRSPAPPAEAEKTKPQAARTAQRIWVRFPGGQAGPFSPGQVRQLAQVGQIGPDTPVSADQHKWVPAARVRGLSLGQTRNDTPKPAPSGVPSAAALPPQRVPANIDELLDEFLAWADLYGDATGPPHREQLVGMGPAVAPYILKAVQEFLPREVETACPNFEARTVLCLMLGEIGGEESVEALGRIALRPSNVAEFTSDVRPAAVEALKMIGTARCRSILRQVEAQKFPKLAPLYLPKYWPRFRARS